MRYRCVGLETAIVSVYPAATSACPGAGQSGSVGGAASAVTKDTPDRGQRPRGWQRKGRAEARNASAEPRREVEQLQRSASFTRITSGCRDGEFEAPAAAREMRSAPWPPICWRGNHGLYRGSCQLRLRLKFDREVGRNPPAQPRRAFRSTSLRTMHANGPDGSSPKLLLPFPTPTESSSVCRPRVDAPGPRSG